jgi:hypothetical protein
MSERLSYEDSFRVLQREGWEAEGPLVPMLSRAPRYDDEVLGVSFFRTLVEGSKFDNLTLPRTYFSRSEIRQSSFVDADLHESVANWNDVEDVDFSRADLSRFDFRGCDLQGVNFDDAVLVDADLRCCGFRNCSFVGADLTRTKITREAGALLPLSAEQRSQIDWQETDGPDPDGG